MAIYGYCCISTKKQSLERQIRNIKSEYPTATIVEEAYSGTTMERKEWNKLYKQLKRGDTVVFDSVSRMSRTADEGMQTYEELYSRGVALVFLREHYIDTSTYKNALATKIEPTGTTIDCILEEINKYYLALATEQVKLAFIQSEKEVVDLHQRTREGIQTARLNGKQIGMKEGTKLTTKKSIASKKIILQHSKDFGGSLSDPDVIKLTGLARGTYYKYKRELKAASNLHDVTSERPRKTELPLSRRS